MILTLGAVGKAVKLDKAPFEIDSEFLQGLNAKFIKCFISGTFERTNQNLVLASGKIQCEVATFCSRCGCDVERHLTIPFKEEFSSEGEDCYVLVGSRIELDQMIFDLILTHFPSKILCKENCLGRCEKCGKNLNEGKCGCENELSLSDPANPFNKLKKLKLEGDK